MERSATGEELAPYAIRSSSIIIVAQCACLIRKYIQVYIYKYIYIHVISTMRYRVDCCFACHYPRARCPLIFLCPPTPPPTGTPRYRETYYTMVARPITGKTAPYDPLPSVHSKTDREEVHSHLNEFLEFFYVPKTCLGLFILIRQYY